MSSITHRVDDAMIEIETKSTKIRRDLDQLKHAQMSERAGLESEIDRMLGLLHGSLRSAAGDVRMIKGEDAEMYQEDLERAETAYQSLANEFRSVKSAARSGQSAQLAENERKALGINNDLDEAIRTGNDTLTTANVTMTTLLDDRRRIENIDHNLQSVYMEALDGQTRGKRMLRRVICNGILAWIIALIMIGLFVLVLVLKFKKII